MRKRLFVLTLLLVAGAIVNIAVAWGSCWKSDAGDWTFHSPYSTDVVLAENEYGWPARALTNDPEPKLLSPRRYSLSVGEPRLPLRPIWPGFAINTLLYAGMLWLLFAAPFALRRRRRIKRGLCPKCAYPIGVSDVCTECGADVPLFPRCCCEGEGVRCNSHLLIRVHPHPSVVAFLP
jgi:hypothetical protein